METTPVDLRSPSRFPACEQPPYNSKQLSRLLSRLLSRRCAWGPPARGSLRLLRQCSEARALHGGHDLHPTLIYPRVGRNLLNLLGPRTGGRCGPSKHIKATSAPAAEGGRSPTRTLLAPLLFTRRPHTPEDSRATAGDDPQAEGATRGAAFQARSAWVSRNKNYYGGDRKTHPGQNEAHTHFKATLKAALRPPRWEGATESRW